MSSGIQADLVIVAAARPREGTGAVRRRRPDAEGFERGRKLDKVGRKAQDTAELFFDDVAVPPEDVIGEVGRGLQLLMRNLPQERLSIAVTAVASAERALEITLDYVKDAQRVRQAGRLLPGQPLLARRGRDRGPGRARLRRPLPGSCRSPAS